MRSKNIYCSRSAFSAILCLTSYGENCTITSQQACAHPTVVGPLQVFDMFHQQHGRGRETGRRSSAKSGATSGGADTNNHDYGTPPPLSPSALRAGLGSLGIPLGDDDFATLIATTDPDRRGEVSYPNFCAALNLHRLRSSDVYGDRRRGGSRSHGGSGKGGGADFPPQRSSSAPPRQRSSQTTRQGAAVGGGGGGGGGDSERGGEGGGYARRRAMKLAPPADARTDLEGGVFHLNPATHGWANPNFTTTMIPVWNGRGGRTAREQQSAEGAYRSKRRQSPADVHTKAKRQTIYVVGGGAPFDETGVEAEKLFRRGLGVKMRYPTVHAGVD